VSLFGGNAKIVVPGERSELRLSTTGTSLEKIARGDLATLLDSWGKGHIRKTVMVEELSKITLKVYANGHFFDRKPKLTYQNNRR
jgi:hypothetical protein